MAAEVGVAHLTFIFILRVSSEILHLCLPSLESQFDCELLVGLEEHPSAQNSGHLKGGQLKMGFRGESSLKQSICSALSEATTQGRKRHLDGESVV